MKVSKKIKKEFIAEEYNDIYKKVDAYTKDPEDVYQYIDMWRSALNILTKENAKNIIDLGCGPGQFAKLIEKNIKINQYIGIDFSDYAINLAKNNFNNEKFIFLIKNLKTYDFKELDQNSIYITFEFLEHIVEDLDVLKKIPAGRKIIFSVPSFDYKNHVRHFPNIELVKSRYSIDIDIKNIEIFNVSPSPGILTDKYIYLCFGIKK